MVLGMSFSDTSSIWSPSCHRVPSTPPNPRAGPTPPPFQGWQNSPVLKTKDCHEYHLRSHLRQPELVCCPKVDMLPTRLVQVWSDHQPEILNSTKSKIQSDVNEWPASRLKGWSWTREDQVFRLRQSAQPAPGRHIPWEPGWSVLCWISSEELLSAHPYPMRREKPWVQHGQAEGKGCVGSKASTPDHHYKVSLSRV